MVKATFQAFLGVDGEMQDFEDRDLGFAVVRRAPDGIVEVRFIPGSIVDSTEMRAILHAQSLLRAGGALALTLVDARTVRTMTRAAQDLSASVPAKGVAILVGNPVSVLLGNVFLTLSAPDYPTRLFRSEPEARAWLLSLDQP